MTKGATRKPRFRYGTVRKMAGGGIALDFIEEFSDLGAPEFAVTGTASIERISPGLVRITMYSRRKDGNIVTHHTIWDWQTLKRSVALYEEAIRVLDRMTVPDGPNDDQRSERH